MHAILLAAGAGRKFWPYNEVRNKCAFPIGNVPVVRRLAEQLLQAGVAGLVVALGAQPGSVRAALAGLEDHVLFEPQPRPDGTADALLRCLERTGEAPVVVAHADVVTTPETVARVVEAARRGETPAAAVAQPLGGGRPGDWITASPRTGLLAEV